MGTPIRCDFDMPDCFGIAFCLLGTYDKNG